jgi:4-hydroxy-3-polyprenylbenzoate decarboxylase
VARDITSMRGVIEFLKERNELLTVAGEADPICEISAIQKALEEGPALLFENVKGYPGVRTLGNVMSREDRVAAIFDVDERRQLKFKCIEAMKNPIPPRLVADAPCQEVVITDNIDVMGTIPMIKYTESDGGRILGSGILLATGPQYPAGSELAFKRMHFRGKDWGSVWIVRPTHIGYMRDEMRGERMPLTINICVPPAIELVAATQTIHVIVPYGTDDLGIAGALQGSPVEICKAKTIDAHAVANAEWVIEGYVLPEKIWETDEAEKAAKKREAPFFPEWPGYMGKATVAYKFQATAITHRKDKPMFYPVLADSFECENITAWREACFFELADRYVPGLVQDVNILHGFKQGAGVTYKVKKRGSGDDGVVKNILESAISQGHLRMALAVDEDVDLYNADELLWAIWSRTNLDVGIFKTARGSRGTGMIPAMDIATSEYYEGGLAIDTTLPFAKKGLVKRVHYAVDKIDLKKWFSEAQIEAIRASQSEYARLLASKGG